MLDGNATTMDWQRHPGDVCILPIGSVEQHGAHMPLATDALAAEYFARLVGAELGAAVLPVQAYGNCLEHSRFRGSVSLRPETLMQVLRDIAEELERQQFRILLVMNGHGGNLSLAPAIRAFNREDRALKILLLNWWEFAEPTFAAESAALGKDVHAGELETSVMLAICPALVGTDRRDMPAQTGAALPLRQSDLNTFGTGHFNPDGPIGFPSYATAAKGDALLAAVRQHMIPFVRDRISRLRQTPDYAGRAGLCIRPLVATDIPECMRLKAVAGWNQTEFEWQFALQTNPAGCFAAVHNGRLVGTATTVTFEQRVAWIGMVLVDPALRGLGIGRRLMKACIESAAGCPSIKLDATPMGRPLYLKLGFQDEYALHRFVLPDAMPPTVAGVGAEPVTALDFAEIAAWDRQLFGADRRALLEAYWRNCPGLAFILRREGRLRAFAFARRGSFAHDLGPLVAETVADAQTVAAAALAALPGQSVIVDVPAVQGEFMAWLRQAGFTPQRQLTRMFLGGHESRGDPARQFAIAGPEFG